MTDPDASMYSIWKVESDCERSFMEIEMKSYLDMNLNKLT